MGQIYAILLRIAAAGLLVAMSALVYEALKEATIGQAVFWRSLWSLPVILIYARCFGPLRGVLKTDHPFHHVRRGLLGLMAMGLHFMCLAHLPISYATALGFLTPILALPLAFAMLGERITRVLILASFLGFGGVLLISFAQLENGGLPPASIIG
ncbi:MAG: EamA family transporter, partial [Paracoccaceae bacterium]